MTGMTGMTEKIQELKKKARSLSGARTNKECREAALAAYKLVELVMGHKALGIGEGDDKEAHIESIFYVMSVVGETRSKCNGFVQGFLPTSFLNFLRMALASAAHNKRARAEVWKKYCRNTIDVFWPEETNESNQTNNSPLG